MKQETEDYKIFTVKYYLTLSRTEVRYLPNLVYTI
jgi:hypothetical protein